MKSVKVFLFEIYESIFDDSQALEDRKIYLIDNIYTLLEKSLFPVKHSAVKRSLDLLFDEIKTKRENGDFFSIFEQVNFIVNNLKINDIILFKKIYDCYNDSTLQISPALYHNTQKTLKLLKENDKTIYLIGNNFYSSGMALRFLLKENNIYEYFDGIVFADEVSSYFFNPSILEYFKKRFTSDFVFVTNFKNWHYDRNLEINTMSISNGIGELYDLILSE